MSGLEPQVGQPPLVSAQIKFEETFVIEPVEANQAEPGQVYVIEVDGLWIDGGLRLDP